MTMEAKVQKDSMKNTILGISMYLKIDPRIKSQSTDVEA